MSKNSDDYLIFTVGTLFGILAGVIAGVIYSPKSGAEMRKELRGMAKNITNEVPNDVDKAKKVFNTNIDRLKYTMENQINKINDAVKAGRMASAKEKEEQETGY